LLRVSLLADELATAIRGPWYCCVCHCWPMNWRLPWYCRWCL